MSQSHFIEKILDYFKCLDFNIVKSPINVRFSFQKNEGESDSQLDCARVLRSKMYIIKCVRPNITYTINELSGFTSDPNQTHWMTMKRVLKYLRNTQNYILYFNNIEQYWKDIMIQIGSLDKWRNPQVDIYLLLVEDHYLGNSPKISCIDSSAIIGELGAVDKVGE